MYEREARGLTGHPGRSYGWRHCSGPGESLNISAVCVRVHARMCVHICRGISGKEGCDN